MKGLHVFLLFWLVAFALVAFCSVQLWDDYDISHHGKELFRTEEEYGAFKEAVASEEVDIGEMLVLSSEPPIVVEFQVTTDKDVGFGYGEADKGIRRGEKVAMFGGGLVLAVGCGIFLGVFVKW